MSKDSKKSLIILIVTVLIIIVVLVLSNVMSNKKKEENTDSGIDVVDYNEVDNVAVVDEKLKEGDYRVTQGYLLNYTKRKSNTWYSSYGIILDYKVKNKDVIITLGQEKSTNKIIAHIDQEYFNFKKKDKVYFVGTIDLVDGSLNLSRISKEEIDYNNVVELPFNDLYMNIYYLKNTYVIVSGYMITAAAEYKLYESKESYKKDETLGTYFYLEWADKFNYTGTSNVLVKCFIGDRYKLIGCELIQ